MHVCASICTRTLHASSATRSVCAQVSLGYNFLLSDFRLSIKVCSHAAPDTCMRACTCVYVLFCRWVRWRLCARLHCTQRHRSTLAQDQFENVLVNGYGAPAENHDGDVTFGSVRQLDDLCSMGR